MRVWTIQPESIYQQLQSVGIFRANKRFIEPDWRNAYTWMVDQMAQRVCPPPPDCDSLIWVWYRWASQYRPKPDLRAGGHLPVGTRGVRLELEIPDDAVLLSDFEFWHYVLNYWYLARSEAEAELFDIELECFGLDFAARHSVPDSSFHQRVVASWQHIFNISEENSYSTVPQEERSIQGVVWQVSLEQVKKATLFVAR